MCFLILARFVEGGGSRDVVAFPSCPSCLQSSPLLLPLTLQSHLHPRLTHLHFLPLRLLPPPPASSLSLARLRLDRGTSSSPSLSFPVLLFRGHVRLRPPRAPTRPPLFFSPALLFCSPPLYPLPNPPLLNLPLSQYPCFPCPFSLSRSSIRTPFLSSPLLLYALPLSPPPLLLSSTFSHFPEIRSFSVVPPIFPLPARQPQPF